MKKNVLTAIIATSLLATGAAFAGGHGKGKGKCDDDFGRDGVSYRKMYRKLDLNDTQKEQIKAIFKNARSADRGKQFQARQAQMQQRLQLIQTDSLDYTALQTLANTQAETMKQRFMQSAETQHAAWKVLTPEQQEEVKALQAKRLKKMEKRMQKRLEKRRDKKDD